MQFRLTEVSVPVFVAQEWLIYTAAIMSIRKILRNRVYLVLALIYAISVVAICFCAPVVQRPVQLRWDDVEQEPAASSPQPATSNQDDLDFVPVTGPGGKPLGPQPVKERAPIWAIGKQLSLNVRLFAAEQVELIGLVLLIALSYRFRARIVNWGAATAAFVASRRRGTCIWLGFAIVLLLTLFPPWVQVNTYGGRYPTQRVELWHARIDRAPVETTRWQSSEIDYARMLMEIAVGECFVLALYLTWARTKLTVNSKG